MTKFVLIVIPCALNEEPYTFFCNTIKEVRQWHDHVEECHATESRRFEYYLFSLVQEVE